MCTGDSPAWRREDHAGAVAPRTDSTADVLRPAAAALGLWYAGLTVLHLTLLTGTERVVMTCTAAVSAVLLAASWGQLRRRRPARESPVGGTMLAGLVAVNSLLHLYMSQEPAQSTNVMMTVIGGGALIQNRRWARALVTGCCVGWTGIALTAAPHPLWVHFGIGMATAVALASLLHVTRARTVTRLAAAEAVVRRAAVTDELTGLANRRGLLTAARPLLLSASRAGTPVTVLYLDVNGLKQVNDTQGHAAGDRIITRAAAALSAALREADVVARVGGDEFAAVLAGSGPGDVPPLLARVHRRLADVGVSASCGVAHASTGQRGTGPGETLESLLDRADAAMYVTKRRSTRPPGGRDGAVITGG